MSALAAPVGLLPSKRASHRLELANRRFAPSWAWRLLILAVPIALLPLFVKSSYGLTIMIFIGLNTIITVGLCLLIGYAGQISLGHAAFYGLGAYASAIVTATLGYPPLLGLIAAVLLPAVVAFALAQPIFKLKGHYLAMATLGFGFIVYIIFTEAISITGGPSGLTGIPYFSIDGIVFSQDRSYFYLVWGVVLVVMAAALNIVRSRFGRALRAIHDSEVAAEAMGVNATRLKTYIFVFSAALAGLAGSLYAHYVTFVNPSPFGFHFSVTLVVMAAVGGMGTVWGAPFGAAVVTLLTEMLRTVIPKISNHASGEYEIIAFGLLLMFIMILMPQGVVQTGIDLWKRRRNHEYAGQESACSVPRRAWFRDLLGWGN
jgi:branched-chain amino acid transport system permease protein